MVAYNLTVFMNVTEPAQFLQVSNDVSGGMLGVGVLIVWFGVSIITFLSEGYTAKTSITAATFITTILSIVLFIMGLVSWLVVGMMIVLTGVFTVLSTTKS